MIVSRLITIWRGKLHVGNLSRSLSNFPKVKIVHENGDNSIKISFQYGSVPYSQNNMNLVVPKEEELQSVLSRIKLMISLQQKKAKLRRTVMNHISGNMISDRDIDVEDGELDVCLMHNNKLLEDKIDNETAWSEGSLLKIGDHIYEINENVPTVLDLSLPKYIVSGCIIRAHVTLECCEILNCVYTWYRSILKTEAEKLKAVHKEVEVINENYWLKVHEGFSYCTSEGDIGRKLRVVCVPMHGDKSGVPFSAESEGIVELPVENFPFENRHAYTRELTDDCSIRCLTYNVLANVYVEKKKFPYCSTKTRDYYYRKQLALRELLGYNSDIICLQEVQGRMFDLDLMPVLQKFGFDGFYTKKAGRRHEGLACFFRASKFNVVSKHGVILNQVVKNKDIFTNLLNQVSGNFKDMAKLLCQDTVLQIIFLEHKEKPHRRIMVANTHLYSNKDTPEVRLIQSALCINYIEHVLETEGSEDTALLFCGDFNSLPSSAAVEFLKSGSFQCCSSWKNSAANSSTDAVLKHNLFLDSACGIPEYTNYTENFYGCLDYIFFSTNMLNVMDVVPMPSHESVTKEVGLPNELFPSDHIALVCTLKWKDEMKKL